MKPANFWMLTLRDWAMCMRISSGVLMAFIRVSMCLMARNKFAFFFTENEQKLLYAEMAKALDKVPHFEYQV